MNKKIKNFEVSSPDQLGQALADYQQDEAIFASVRVLGPQVLTRQFNFPNSSYADLIIGLKHEASDTLTSAADIELSCQILGMNEQGIHGIYSAMPRQLLLEYLECFKVSPLIPVSLTASAVAGVMDFLKEHDHVGENFCLVNFLQARAVSIIIFANGKPAFFRELYDLNDSDFRDKITDTIRYSCSQSASKSINHIFFIGDLTGKEELIKNIRKLENSPWSQQEQTSNASLDLTGLNLLGKYVFNVDERSRLVRIFSIISIIFILLSAILIWDLSIGYSKVQEETRKVNISDYNRALDLQDQIRRLNHAK